MNGRARCRGGAREDLGGIYFRSMWEANYARYLSWLVSVKKILAWEYEPQTFVFEAIKRGTRFYTPDFKIINPDGTHEWHEVKGWMDGQSRTRLSRMAKYFPNEKVCVIGPEWFRAANRNVAPLIPHWERGTTR